MVVNTQYNRQVKYYRIEMHIIILANVIPISSIRIKNKSQWLEEHFCLKDRQRKYATSNNDEELKGEEGH